MTADNILALVEEYGQAVGWGQSRKSSTLLAQIGAAVARLANQAGGADPVVEHAILMSGGSMQVRPDDPEIEEVYPLAKWIPNQQRFGGKVYRRTVIVVDDWEEVTP